MGSYRPTSSQTLIGIGSRVALQYLLPTMTSQILELPVLMQLAERVAKQTSEQFRHARKNYTAKDDGSPVSAADLMNHELLVSELPKIKQVPVWSEEDYPTFSSRQSVSMYWLIDPIDGTKEFISGIPEFCVLIALIENRRPVLSLIIAPEQAKMFWAEQGRGAYLIHNESVQKLSCSRSDVASVKRGVVSRFHGEDAALEFYRANGISETVPLGSALKFCAVASGDAEVYYRKSGPHEWDVAAGDLLVGEAGGMMVSDATSKPILYNCEETRVGSFLAQGLSLESQSTNL